MGGKNPTLSCLIHWVQMCLKKTHKHFYHVLQCFAIKITPSPHPPATLCERTGTESQSRQAERATQSGSPVLMGPSEAG